MASKFTKFSSFITLFLLTFFVLSTVGETITSTNHGIGRDRVQNIVNAISDAGYISMSLALSMTLDTLTATDGSINSSTTNFTIFCPPDEAFFSLKYPQPPLDLLKYHIVPMKVTRDTLESSLIPSPSSTLLKINTLLPNHSLVVTPVNNKLGFTTYSINFVRVMNWEMYNDGYVVVHGVEDFFDPSTRSSYNNERIDTNKTNSSRSSIKSTKKELIEGLVIALREGYNVIWMFAAFMVFNFIAYIFLLIIFEEESCIRRRHRTDDDDDPYIRLSGM